MSSKIIRWGILGTGFIAGEFVRGLNSLANVTLLGVASRKPSNAEAFAKIFAVQKSYQTYEELVNDPDIDVVYIATPNQTHKDLCILALEAGKPVLCEKPFTLNAKEAEVVIEVARRQQLFCMEAMWMRFMPLIQTVKQLINLGKIGKIKMLTADFGYPFAYDPESRFFQPEFGGGALLDRGVYGLSLSYYLLGEPLSMVTQNTATPSGVDEQSSIILKYPKGALAILTQSLGTYSSNQAVIMGTSGKILIEELFIKPEKISVVQFKQLTQSYPSPLIPLSSKEKLLNVIKQNYWVRQTYLTFSSLLHKNQTIVEPLKGNGYNYEAVEVMKCLHNGQLESEIMPLDETLKIMKTIDQIRHQWC